MKIGKTIVILWYNTEISILKTESIDRIGVGYNQNLRAFLLIWFYLFNH